MILTRHTIILLLLLILHTIITFFYYYFNKAYYQILNGVKDNHNDDEKRTRNLIEKLELLNTKIDDNQKLIPSQCGSGISFSKGNEYVSIPSIGDINYDSVFKIDMITKINNFNNSFQHRLFDLTSFLEKNAIQGHFSLISKNKIFLLYEKIYGKVKSTFMKVIYYDGSILKETEVKNVGSFISYFLTDKYILVLFQKCKSTCIIELYDLNLKLQRDQQINYDVSSVFMNDERIFLLRDHSPLVFEYDYELNFRNSFGQITKEKKPYYLKDEIVAIANEKIYVKMDNELRIISCGTGDLLSKISIIDLKTSRIYLDYNKEKFVTFNGFNKISYFNHLGELIVENKLRHHETFDEFHFTKSGHFAFLNTEKRLLLAI